MSGSLIKFKKPPCISSWGTVAGRREEEGPLGGRFDISDNTDRFGKDSWEKSESEMQRMALERAILKAGMTNSDVDAVFAGDLINQCTSSSYGLMSFGIPHFGIYGACSTIAEGLMISSAMVSGGIYRTAAAVCSSHYCSAERQFRSPLEYGSQRAPSAQWTVTGSAAFIVSESGVSFEETDNGEYLIGASGTGCYITEALPGRIFDSGLTDMTDMGAAMAPAAADTFLRYFAESGREPGDFDVIATGDLGLEGSRLLLSLTGDRGLELGPRYTDCGLKIYNLSSSDVHSGGSGCACSGLVLGAELLPRLMSGRIKDILLVATGALMSPTSVEQGGTIPGIAHLIHISSEKG